MTASRSSLEVQAQSEANHLHVPVVPDGQKKLAMWKLACITARNDGTSRDLLQAFIHLGLK